MERWTEGCKSKESNEEVDRGWRAKGRGNKVADGEPDQAMERKTERCGAVQRDGEKKRRLESWKETESRRE